MPETKINEYITPGAPITREILKRLRNTWMETYIALFIIGSITERKELQEMKTKLAEANEAVMAFFDAQGVGD